MMTPTELVLSRLPAAKKRGKGWSARCPAHDDHNPSLSITQGNDGRALLKCHAGCATADVVKALGLKMADLMPPKIGGNGHKPKANGKSRIVARYGYTDELGVLIFEVVRFDPKDFRQRRPDGNGGYVWNLDGVGRVLYRLPAVIAASPDSLIFVVEGERDADSLTAAGLIATTSSGGAGKWALTDSTPLHGRHVVVVPDHDPPGEAHAQDVAKDLNGKAASVRIVRLPAELNGKTVKDATDWLDAGGDAESLEALADVAPLWTPTLTATADRFTIDTRHTPPAARAFVASRYTNPAGTKMMVSYAGMSMVHLGTSFVEVEDGALRREVYSFLENDVEDAEGKPIRVNANLVNGVLDALAAHVHVAASLTPPAWLTPRPDMPQASELIACKTKLLYLPTMTFIDATPAYFTTSALSFDPEPNAPPPTRWLAFLAELFGDDQEQREALQEYFGYCLTADTAQHKIGLIVGPKRSGKGTIARVLAKLIGENNVAAPTTSSLAGAFGLQPLIGKSLAIVADARFSGEGVTMAMERLLSISGEDRITIDRKHRESITLKLPTRFLILSNELPRLHDSSAAIASRFFVIKLTKSFYGVEDTALTDTLTTELPGIFMWAVEGWRRLKERGRFIQPQAGVEAQRQIEDLSSPVGAFVRELCTVGPGCRAWCDEMFKEWKDWCSREGLDHPGTAASFGRDLAAIVPSVKRRRSTGMAAFYEGIRLATARNCLDSTHCNYAGAREKGTPDGIHHGAAMPTVQTVPRSSPTLDDLGAGCSDPVEGTP